MVCYTEATTIQRIFHMNSHLLGPTKAVCYREVFATEDVVVSGSTVHPQHMYCTEICTYSQRYSILTYGTVHKPVLKTT